MKNQNYTSKPPSILEIKHDKEWGYIATETRLATDVDIENANLIAAAPDLLSALIALEKASRKVLDTSATHDGLENCKTLLEARIAIQKAKGEA